MTDNTLYRMNGPIRTLDPAQTVTSSAERVVAQLYEPLFDYVYDEDGSVTTTPHLVASRETPSETTRRYRLRQDVTFADGTPLTASDVAYTLERVAAADASVRSDLLLDTAGVTHERDDGEYVPGTLGVEAVDDHTVEVRLEAPFRGLEGVLADLRTAVVPAGRVDDVPGVDGDLSQEEFARTPCGTGPFTLEAFDPDYDWSPTAEEAQHWVPPTDDPEEELVLRARDDYRESCSLDAIHYRVADIERRHELSRAGKSEQFYVRRDYVRPELFSEEHVDEFGRRYGTYGPIPESGLTADYLAVRYQRTHFLVFDTDRVPRNVRRAVAYLTDLAALTAGPKNGRADPAGLVTPPELLPEGPDTYERLHGEVSPFDTAERQVAAAEDALGDSGSAVSELVIEGEPYRRRTCEWLASELSTVDIDAAYAEVTFDELRDRQEQGDVDAYLVAYDADYDAFETFHEAVVPQNDAFGTGWGGTDASRRAADAWDRLQSDLRGDNGDNRQEAFREIERAVFDDVPVLPLYYGLGERFSHQWVSFEPFGPGSRHRARLHRVEIGDRPDLE